MSKLLDLLLGLIFWILLGLCAFEVWHGNANHAGGAFLGALFVLFLGKVLFHR